LILLSNDQRTVLRAAVDRIIPADDFPSGWESGVGDYFTQLFLPTYLIGLKDLDLEAEAVYGTSFAMLSEQHQDQLLEHVEKGDVRSSWNEESSKFFNLLVEQTMEGYYADPGNGGNKNCISWDMIGYKATA
jgi:hypothetical protein